MYKKQYSEKKVKMRAAILQNILENMTLRAIRLRSIQQYSQTANYLAKQLLTKLHTKYKPKWQKLRLYMSKELWNTIS